MPPRAHLCDVGPRDGFQFEARPIPTDLKVETIRALALAGLPRIQATSFVHPGRVPQMADAEAVLASLDLDGPTVFSALALNARGVERAAKAGVRVVDLSIATNPQHARDNANMTVEQGVAEAETMLRLAREAGMQAQLGFQTVWGYAAPEDTPLDLVTDLARRFADAGLESLSLADSTGLANPVSIRSRVRAVQEAVPNVALVLHLHDTRGAGLANVVAALEEGVTRFDTSLGGLGGCPFIPGATGNIATEDTVYLLDGMGVATGVNLATVAAATRRIAEHLGRELPGKLYRLAT
ncbi:MAG TPA: hydroxymethylglutaryl-CoA lyase [Rhodothermales bacterium]|nr:hydroxymethylglutaryl-CoA lyase [Rhodothermales bacterium]